MPLNYTLENSILEDIQIIKDSIYSRKFWTSFNYTYTLDKLAEIENHANALYLKKSTTTLKDACRQFFDNTFIGDIDLFITYFNVILYMKKLQYRVLWHQKYGTFPKD